MTYIATERGTPMKKESCANWFRDACRAASVPGSPHGLRKTAATRAADNGATEAELEALFGWRGGDMASLYTRCCESRATGERCRRKIAHGNGQKSNTYPRTYADGAGGRAKTQMKSDAKIFSGGGRSLVRTRLSNKIPC